MGGGRNGIDMHIGEAEARISPISNAFRKSKRKADLVY